MVEIETIWAPMEQYAIICGMSIKAWSNFRCGRGCRLDWRRRDQAIFFAVQWGARSVERLVATGMAVLAAGCLGTASPEASVLDLTAGRYPGLVACWDFGRAEAPLRSVGAVRATLSPGAGADPATVAGGPLSGRALRFDGKTDYLTLPYAKTGALNVRSGQVTVVGWVKWVPGGVGFVGGMWNEHQDGGKRQYGLFVSLPHYNGGDQVCGHVSRKGGPTPPFPYSIDYSASAQKVPADTWCCVAFTYDGECIRSYLDGRFEPREPELIDHTKGFPGYPEGLVQSKNPYRYPDGIGDNGSDFTVGAVCLARGMGNFFHGDMAGLAVYDRALSAEELRELADATLASRQLSP